MEAVCLAQPRKHFGADANFRGADLSNAVIESVDFEGADLTGAVLSEVQVAKSPLILVTPGLLSEQTMIQPSKFSHKSITYYEQAETRTARSKVFELKPDNKNYHLDCWDKCMW